MTLLELIEELLQAWLILDDTRDRWAGDDDVREDFVKMTGHINTLLRDGPLGDLTRDLCSRCKRETCLLVQFLERTGQMNEKRTYDPDTDKHEIHEAFRSVPTGEATPDAKVVPIGVVAMPDELSDDLLSGRKDMAQVFRELAELLDAQSKSKPRGRRVDVHWMD